MPCISVIIPAYNHEQYVGQCIDSVLAQTFTDFEIIVVDDGSLDGTAAVLERYEERLTIIRQANQGTQAARNTAIRASSGRYIALLDSDDAWLPDKLERQVATFAACPAAGLVYAQAYFIDAQGSRLGMDTIGKPIENMSTAYEQILIEDPVPALTALVRRECLEEVGLFDESLIGAADWDMWLRIAAKWPVIGIAEPLALYRIHQTNTTKALFRTKAICFEHKQVLLRAFQLPESVSLSPQVRNKALAKINLLVAEAEATDGNATAIGIELRQAIERDSTLLEDLDELGNLLIHWAHLYAANSSSTSPYRQFTSEVFSQVSVVIPSVSRMRRRVLSDAVMGTVFPAHAAGNRAKVRRLLPTALYANPKWLLNRGVWSILADAFLGQNTTAGLRNAIRKLRELRT